jgi:lysine 2,3-aminomutase
VSISKPTQIPAVPPDAPLGYPLSRDFVEPDWRRLPGYRGVSRQEWEQSRWQRAHTIKNLRQLRDALGSHLPVDLAADIERDQRERATMPILVPPHMLNTMDEHNLWDDPVRRYMLPAFSDRCADWPSHPFSRRDSLHEREMWTVEGLTHRYPTKVLVELLATCPQYCGHCTRMDLVGTSTNQVDKYRFTVPELDRRAAMLDYVRSNNSIRDVVVSGGDVANVPIQRLVEFVTALVEIPHVRDVRLASKSLVALPQHFLRPDVVAGLARMAQAARARNVSLVLHTHANHARQVTPLVAKAARLLMELGFRDVRNQAVLMRGVNGTVSDVLELCFTLLDRAGIVPYYVFVCDMVPNAEHWRTSVWKAQEIQRALMGYLPGFATPRIVCDVPLLGKAWVDQVDEYDRELGISYWTKHYRTSIEQGEGDVESRRYRYFDPIDTLPESGRAWWRSNSRLALAAG